MYANLTLARGQVTFTDDRFVYRFLLFNFSLCIVPVGECREESKLALGFCFANYETKIQFFDKKIFFGGKVQTNTKNCRQWLFICMTKITLQRLSPKKMSHNRLNINKKGINKLQKIHKA